MVDIITFYVAYSAINNFVKTSIQQNTMPSYQARLLQSLWITHELCRFCDNRMLFLWY
jgi:hypothetical protein